MTFNWAKISCSWWTQVYPHYRRTGSFIPLYVPRTETFYKISNSYRIPLTTILSGWSNLLSVVLSKNQILSQKNNLRSKNIKERVTKPFHQTQWVQHENSIRRLLLSYKIFTKQDLKINGKFCRKLKICNNSKIHKISRESQSTENRTLTYLQLKTKKNTKLDMTQNNRSKPLRCLTFRRGQELERAFRYSKESEIAKTNEIL